MPACVASTRLFVDRANHGNSFPDDPPSQPWVTYYLGSAEASGLPNESNRIFTDIGNIAQRFAPNSKFRC
jgi:hypothetical protein